ncbi:MAG: histidine phosphatase family protein [Methylobacterium mesophilicum]|nr:histidine phosphatase family protein [Methylobacterium mesophilicum]
MSLSDAEAIARLPLIYFVRHGETAWNAEGRLQGQSDTDISAHGREQADSNGARLKELIGRAQGFDFVASPMRRTRETMERLRAAMGLDPQAYRTDPRLVELSFGDWQGFSYEELEQRDPGVTAERLADKWRFVPPGEGAESYALLLERVRPAILGFRGPTVCVTHGGIIRTLFVMAGALTPDEAAVVDTPQNKILRLDAGKLDWL